MRLENWVAAGLGFSAAHPPGTCSNQPGWASFSVLGSRVSRNICISI
jgi:hypothetical protein